MGLIYLFTRSLGLNNESLFRLSTFLPNRGANVHSQPVLINQYSMKSSESLLRRSNTIPQEPSIEIELLVTQLLKVGIKFPPFVSPYGRSRATSRLELPEAIS
jgi:hypothetical protein